MLPNPLVCGTLAWLIKNDDFTTPLRHPYYHFTNKKRQLPFIGGTPRTFPWHHPVWGPLVEWNKIETMEMLFPVKSHSLIFRSIARSQSKVLTLQGQLCYILRHKGLGRKLSDHLNVELLCLFLQHFMHSLDRSHEQSCPKIWQKYQINIVNLKY